MGLTRLAGIGFLGVVLLGALTYAAGERTEVVVVRTLDEERRPHDTKVWVVDLEGVPWVRVANPERRWLRRLRLRPEAELVRGGVTQAVVAQPDDSAQTRAVIDGLFREKYGLVDWWYGVLVRRHAIPVRLEPAPPPQRAAPSEGAGSGSS